MAYTAYKVPGRDEAESTKLGWLKEAVQESAAYLSRQRAAQDYANVFDILSGRTLEKIPNGHSKVKSNRLKRQLREVVSTLSDIRPMWQYATDNSAYDQQNNVLNKLALAWWFNSFADRAIREALQWACAAGQGWICPTYKKEFYTVGRGEIVLEAMGPMAVLPVQLPADGDIQGAYAGIIRKEVPIATAHAMYPDFQNIIVPDRDAPTLMADFGRVVQKFLSPVLNIFGNADRKSQTSGKFPTVDLYYAYIKDMSINMTPNPIPMGEPGTSWYYVVPPFGSDIPSGFDAQGNVLYRKATVEDSMLYPMRRLIVFTNSGIISDGSSPWWHGKIPAVRVTVDDWPWEMMGFSLLRDGAPLEEARNELMRSMQNSARVRMRPPVQYDKNSVSKADMEKLDLLSTNTKIGVDTNMGEKITPLLSWEYYEIPPAAVALMEKYENEMDYLLGVKDLTAFAKARALPAGDLQQIEEFAGPLVKDISRGLERSLRDLGEMVKPEFFQFYNIARRVQILGTSGVTEEDFDYDPGNMVPSHFPGEDKTKASQFNYYDRARRHCNNFFFHVTPGSMHQITQMSQKLLYLQLQRAGFPLDPWTMAEAFNIPNFGPPPKGANTVMERFVAWGRMKMEQQEQAMEMQLKLQAAAAQQQQGQAAIGQIAAAAAQSSMGQPPKKDQGRPPTAQKAPHIQQKDNGARSTISES